MAGRLVSVVDPRQPASSPRLIDRVTARVPCCPGSLRGESSRGGGDSVIAISEPTSARSKASSPLIYLATQYEPSEVPVTRPGQRTSPCLGQGPKASKHARHATKAVTGPSNSTVSRLSRPSLVTQYPTEAPLSNPSTLSTLSPASLAYRTDADTDAAPFLLSPILNLPVSFGSAYVGETFSCTLCANNDLPIESTKKVCDVRMSAEMKTPGVGAAHTLDLTPEDDGSGRDLLPGGTLQKVVSFDLKDEGNHVLAVTVSYYEASETSGRTRTFRKLYQFICKPSLIVRTKVGPLGTDEQGRRKWALEAQLENCSEDVVQLEKVMMELDKGYHYGDCNWETSGGDKPVLHPGEVEQVCFVIGEEQAEDAEPPADGRVVFGVLGIGWRGQMGNRGFLSTGRLGTRVAR
ncbi:hypothetical protein HIM_00263 [Hirsutella minnesotensis 3608]|nr:hypothetical protein HIM_00263 [Hirsutella minnesotensis 3608]